MQFHPFRIVICEDDENSRMSFGYLVGRDVRTKVTGTVDSTQRLLHTLKRKSPVDAILLDTHSHPHHDLEKFIPRIREQAPHAALVCISEYADSEFSKFRAAVDAGASGYVDKDDVGFAVATAVVQAVQTGFVYSRATAPFVEDYAPQWADRKHAIGHWELHPALQRRHFAVAQMGLIFNMPARVVAEEISDPPRKTIKAATVARYRDEIYQILDDDVEGFYEMRFLAPVQNLLTRTKEQGGHYYGADWAFHVLTQPAVYDHPSFGRGRAARSVVTTF